MTYDKKPIPLTKWALHNIDPFIAPEITTYVSLSGTMPNGDRIITSHIVSYVGRVVRTNSGTLYYIDGDPEPGYMEFLDKIKVKYDSDAPIKLKLGK